MQNNISELGNEIQNLQKVLQEKDLDLQNLHEEVEALTTAKLQKYGPLIKSQHNLLESYAEM